MSEPHRNLLAGAEAGVPSTLLPPDTGPAGLESADRASVVAAVAAHPASSLGWAVLAERALAEGSAADDVTAYAYARTGYHRGLDALRRAGWRGTGPVPWEHEPNRGFLRALWALAEAARRIDETVEYERCAQFLRDSSETAYAALALADSAEGRPDHSSSLE